MDYPAKHQDVWDWLMALRSAELEEGVREYIYWHYKRYYDSFLFLLPWLEGRNNLDILELGAGSHGDSVFAQLLRKFAPCNEVNVYYTGNSDLRYPFAKNLGKATFDLVLCMEVIEHLKDQEESRIELFNGSGILSMLCEVKACLLDQGVIFITTPNPNSYRALRNQLLHKHPFVFDKHPRELNYEYLISVLSSSGYCILREKFNDSWTHEQPGIQEKMREMLEMWGFSSEKREDNIFLLAEPIAIEDS
jgi:hypothetical protein